MKPHHKPRNVKLTPRLIAASSYGPSSAVRATVESVAVVSAPLSYISPAEAIARGQPDRYLP
jgi:hypothetical protein